MRTNTSLMKSVASILIVIMATMPTLIHAQNADIKVVGKEAQQFGVELIKRPWETDININELYPGTSASNTLPDSYFFPPSMTGVDDLKNVFDSQESMDQKGSDAKSSLWLDANSTTPSIGGAAFKVLLDATNRSRPDFINDPILNLSKKTYEDIDLIAEGFGDCSVETQIKETEISAHIPKYEMCQRVVKPVGNCEILHSLGILSQTENIYIASRGRTWLTVEFDLKNGSWKTVAPSDGIRPVAKIPTVNFNEVCTNGVNYKSSHIGSWDWPNHGLPGPVDSTVIYRVIRAPSCDNNLVGVVQIQDTTPSDDIKWVLGGRFSFNFTTQREDSWGPQTCIDDAKKLKDGFCSGTINILEGAKNDKECINFNGVKICPGDEFFRILKPSPLPGIPTLSQKIQVSKLKCDFNVGQMECWTDPQGIRHCPNNEGNNTNSCTKLDNDPKCGFVSAECIDGAQGKSGQCYVFNDTYDCGSDVKIPSLEKDTKYSCAGPIACMGDDCLDINKTKSTDFAKATALLNAAQFLTQDMKCTEEATEEGGDENIDQGCMVFAGDGGTCKIAVGGISDCCEVPSSISMADYLNFIMALPKLDGAIMALEDGSVVKGSYQVLRDVATESWSEITKPFTSYIENISGSVDSFFQPVEAFMDELMEQLKKEVKEVLSKMIQSATQETLTEEAASAAATKLMEGVTTALSTAMTIYTVYVIAITMIKMIWKCEEDEFVMNAKRALGNCSYVGSYCKTKVLGQCIEIRQAYCCYNSPLSRIIQEQVRKINPQLGLSFGDPKNPSCGGIPLELVGELDWDKINLDEWLALLQENGHYANPAELTLDALTGSGNDFNMKGDRVDAEQRVIKRLEGINADEIRKEAAQGIQVKTGDPKQP